MERSNRDRRPNVGGDRKFGGKSSGGRSFGSRDEKGGGNRGFGNGRSDKPTMTKAICSECGNACEVPFKPTGDKPVFCSDCFRNKGGNSGSNQSRFGGRDSGRSKFGEKKMYPAVCSACGEKCEVPFQPTSDKPIYCSNCFEKNGDSKNKNTDQFQKQFEILNVKLDKILKSLSLETPKEIVDTKKIIEKVKIPKIKKLVKKSSKK